MPNKSLINQLLESRPAKVSAAAGWILIVLVGLNLAGCQWLSQALSWLIWKL